MSAIERIIGKLSGYPGVKFGRVGHRLEIGAPNSGGFPLSFVEDREGYQVHFGPYPFRFTDEGEALDYLAFGLSAKCRLREIIRGRPYKWIVEQKNGDQWAPIGERGTLLFPFWKRRTERVYQNALFA